MTAPSAAASGFSRPPWEELRAVDLTSLLPRMASAGATDERASRLLASPRAATAATALVRGLAAEDDRAVARATELLAGLGEGLTPAGDDFLVGALHALWALRGEGAQPLARLVATVAAPRTTDLSAAWLESAANGRAAPPWRALIAALAPEGEEGLEGALAEVLATGHTSGAASLAGFLTTLAALQAARGAGTAPRG